ncbi:MAG: hypothetical protein LBK61_11150 [Spirochaetaceae bacterium]|jgi:hypothetical protein|nr:hypothetical protein [Spirochaetaceae bacterium]
MALEESVLADALKSIGAQMRTAASSGNPKDDDWYAEQLAKAITGQIKTADVNAGIAVTSAKGSLS